MAAASLAGGAAGSFVNRSQDPLVRKLLEGLVGAAVGVFCGPAIANVAGVSGEQVRVAVAFGTGAAGLLLLTGALDLIKNGGLKEWVARWIGEKVPPAPPPA